MIYAGIGSRTTPDNVLAMMVRIASEMAEAGWTLRSGHAGGADTAFESGCSAVNGKKEIFIPWAGFNDAPNNHPDYIVKKPTEKEITLAASFHPNWGRCSNGARKLHIRNLYQIFGHTETSPKTDLVICWTKDGKDSGGTGQALRIAKHEGVPCFNLFDRDNLNDLLSFVKEFENSVKI